MYIYDPQATMHEMIHLDIFFAFSHKRKIAEIYLDLNLQCSIYNLIFTYELLVDLSSL